MPSRVGKRNWWVRQSSSNLNLIVNVASWKVLYMGAENGRHKLEISWTLSRSSCEQLSNRNNCCHSFSSHCVLWLHDVLRALHALSQWRFTRNQWADLSWFPFYCVAMRLEGQTAKRRRGWGEGLGVMDFYSVDVDSHSTGNTRQSVSQCHLLLPEAERPPMVHFIKQCWEDDREIVRSWGRQSYRLEKNTSAAHDVEGILDSKVSP